MSSENALLPRVWELERSLATAVRVNESLRQQLADMTKDRDRLLDVMGEIAGSKSLTATPTQFYQHLQRIASDATIINPEALAATSDLGRYVICEGEPFKWVYRHIDNGDQWQEVEPRNRFTDTLQDRVNELQGYINAGYKYELLPLYCVKEQGK